MLRLALVLCPMLLASCSLIKTPYRETPNSPFVGPVREGLTPMLVFSHGHHTGITLPASAVKAELPALSQTLPGEWLEFGWGDEGYYRTDRLSILLAFRALAYPTPSVMHVFTTNQPLSVNYAYAPAKLYLLDESQRTALVSYRSEQFERDNEGELIDLGEGRYAASRFYRAREKFHYPNTCNSWTAKGLRTIGHEVHGITAPGLWRQIEAASPKSGI